MIDDRKTDASSSGSWVLELMRLRKMNFYGERMERNGVTFFSGRLDELAGRVLSVWSCKLKYVPASISWILATSTIYLDLSSDWCLYSSRLY